MQNLVWGRAEKALKDEEKEEAESRDRSEPEELCRDSSCQKMAPTKMKLRVRRKESGGAGVSHRNTSYHNQRPRKIQSI
ncbi:hypothetical protein J4Q44_G00053090 [Coregonus suidteri]|uniref:Uncharacterized protein n=1 Tax=Coregonus suidteri TaxID=861788 RepID=A0AAN8R022_9TELE